jgi:hypothetical protein
MDTTDCVTSFIVKRDAVLNMRVPVEIKRALQRAAEDDHGRSMSGMAARALREWLEEHGYLKPHAPVREGKGA